MCACARFVGTGGRVEWMDILDKEIETHTVATLP